MSNNSSEVVLVLDSEGTNLGQMSYNAARQLAEDRSLDLVLVDESNVKLKVYKIMDQGKWQYLKKKTRKKSHVQVMKEMNFRVSIDRHDREVKINHIKRFLKKGMDVKISVQMRGREKANFSFAQQKMDEILSELEGLIQIKQRKSSSSLIIAIVRPTQRKCDASEISSKQSKELQNVATG